MGIICYLNKEFFFLKNVLIRINGYGKGVCFSHLFFSPLR